MVASGIEQEEANRLVRQAFGEQDSSDGSPAGQEGAPKPPTAPRSADPAGGARRPSGGRGSAGPSAPGESPAERAGDDYADHMADTPPGGPPPPPAPAVPSSAPPRPGCRWRRLGWRRVLALAGVVLLIAACAVYMLYTLGSNLGLDALLVGVTAAILPVPVLVACSSGSTGTSPNRCI